MLGLAAAAAFSVPAIYAANPADWKPFTTASGILFGATRMHGRLNRVRLSGNTSYKEDWNFDPSKAGTMTSA